jgi:hypothetical protein
MAANQTWQFRHFLPMSATFTGAMPCIRQWQQYLHIIGALAIKIHGSALAVKVQNFRDAFDFSVTYDDGLRGLGQAMRDVKLQMTAHAESGMNH